MAQRLQGTEPGAHGAVAGARQPGRRMCPLRDTQAGCRRWQALNLTRPTVVTGTGLADLAEPPRHNPAANVSTRWTLRAYPSTAPLSEAPGPRRSIVSDGGRRSRSWAVLASPGESAVNSEARCTLRRCRARSLRQRTAGIHACLKHVTPVVVRSFSVTACMRGNRHATGSYICAKEQALP